MREQEYLVAGRPRLLRPIPESQFLNELRVLSGRAGISGGELRFLPSLDAEHARNPRRFAQVEVQTPIFEFTRATLWLPWRYRLALMAHEIGHVLDPEGGEDDADAAAQASLGVKINYDKRWPGKGLQVAS